MIGTLAGLRDYASARGNPAPSTASDEDANSALVRANDYIESAYPRAAMSPEDDRVIRAVYEAAIAELSKPGIWSRVWTEGEAKVLTEVKGIKWQVVGKGGSMTPRSTIIDGLLHDYVSRRSPWMISTE